MDCGGSDCTRCEVGRGCAVGADCVSATCLETRCAEVVPGCLNRTRDGAETGNDCGGPCAACEEVQGELIRACRAS